MATSNDLKNGMVLNIEGQLWAVVEFQHVKPGKGGAFVRTKLRNLRTGNILERTFNAGVRVEQAILDRADMQFLYKEGDDFVFMDTESYEQINISPRALGDASDFLVEGAKAIIAQYKDEIVSVEIAVTVELNIAETEPGIQGDRVTCDWACKNDHACALAEWAGVQEMAIGYAGLKDRHAHTTQTITIDTAHLRREAPERMQGGAVQRRQALGIAGLGVGAVREQAGDQFGLAQRGGQHQRRHFARQRQVGFGAGAQQAIDHADVTHADRRRKRRRSGAGGDASVGAAGEQVAGTAVVGVDAVALLQRRDRVLGPMAEALRQRLLRVRHETSGDGQPGIGDGEADVDRIAAELVEAAGGQGGGRLPRLGRGAEAVEIARGGAVQGLVEQPQALDQLVDGAQQRAGDIVDVDLVAAHQQQCRALRGIGLFGQPLQLFNVLALMLLLGMGIDYGIFLVEHRGDASAWLAVCVGAASTWLSFGLLGLSATPALRAFGLTLLFGIGLVWLLSPLFRPAPDDPSLHGHTCE